MKKLSTFILFTFFLIQNYGIAQNNMVWIQIEDNALPTGSCSVASDCNVVKPELCYALIYTPANSLIFTDYTAFFRIDCADDNLLSVIANQSCIMTDNSTETQACPAIEQRFFSSGNSGTIIVTAGNSYLIHTVCFGVPSGESISVEIREPPAQNVQSNASLGMGSGRVTENLDVADLVINSDAVCATLPVELISFEALQSRDYVALEWSTATEYNNSKFEILKSVDGIEWKRIAEVPGNSSSSENINYSYLDRNPISGINYYLLRQIDYDGLFEFSNIISVDFEKNNERISEIYPNPSNLGLVNLDFIAQDDEKIAASVYNAAGQSVGYQVIQISKGNNNLNFDFSYLDSGIYIIRIENNRNSIYRKLIIRK